jgi:hypothetical protein
MHLLSADKLNDVHDRYTAPLTVGKVDLDKASKSHLLCLTILEKVNNQLIAYFINKERHIVSQCTNNTKILLCTDAAF